MRKKARERCQNFTEEEKDKKRQYHGEHNKNLLEEQKKKLVIYILELCFGCSTAHQIQVLSYIAKYQIE